MEEKQTNCQTYKEHELYQAIFIVNKHAKAAPMPKLLYKLKRGRQSAKTGPPLF